MCPPVRQCRRVTDRRREADAKRKHERRYSAPHSLLFHRLHDFIVGGNWGLEDLLVDLWIQLDPFKVIAHGRTIGELEFGPAQGTVFAVKINFNPWNHPAGAGGLRLEHERADAIGEGLGEDLEMALEIGLAARKTRLEQRQSVAPRAAHLTPDRKTF